jgi:hypothetical protein
LNFERYRERERVIAEEGTLSTALRVGDLVEVRSAQEILATLDQNGELENLPFMPEMLQFCGQRLTVHKVAHKLCDTISASGMRRMENASTWLESDVMARRMAVVRPGVRCIGRKRG